LAIFARAACARFEISLLYIVNRLKTLSRRLNQDEIYGDRQLISLARFTSLRMNQTQLYSTEESLKLVVMNTVFTVGMKMANQPREVPIQTVVWTHWFATYIDTDFRIFAQHQGSQFLCSVAVAISSKLYSATDLHRREMTGDCSLMPIQS